jgi:hypothetical protein
MPSKEIPLRDSPEHFFDSARWNEFLSFFENREAALRNISQPESGIIVYYRREVAKMPTPEAARARRDEHAAELGKALVGQFKDRLVREEIIATGLSSLAVERVRIPGERWTELWPDLVNDMTKGGNLEFTKVRVFEPTDRPTQAAALLDRCIEWMQRRSHEGEGVRKVLQREAIDQFGGDLTSRTFDTAYKAVFSKSRGRPRRNSPQPE